jgi:hypothetical protein
MWLIERPYQTVRKEVWYVVCLAALTAMLRARGLMFSTLARTGLEPTVIETRAVDLVLANQWEVYLSLNFVRTLCPIPNYKKQKQPQHSIIIVNLNRQGYREVKLHVILVGAMGTIYKEYTDKPLADLNLDYHKIKNLTHKLNEHSIRHAFALIKTKYALQYNTSNNSQGLGLVAMAHNILTHTNFFLIVCALGGLPGAGT